MADQSSLQTPGPPAPLTPPPAPKIGLTAELPPVEGEEDIVPPLQGEGGEVTDISQLSTAQLYQLNQEFLDSTVDPTRPLIDDAQPLAVLRAEYENGSPSFVQQIDWLEGKGFHAIRRTRGDGDCFYRSVAYLFVERLFFAPDPPLAVTQAASGLEATLQLLSRAGFEDIVVSGFYEPLEELIKNIIQPVDGQVLTLNGLLQGFQDPMTSNCIVTYLRMLTSAKIRTEPDDFAPFLIHPELGEMMDPRTFCEVNVDPTGKEADHVQMTALSQALGLNIDVAYLDGRSADGAVEFVQFRNAAEENELPMVLLYRPGHYDILIGK
ncbi:peptidase C65 Otubain-domain-containing protein [Schizophyllum amplum]|uniref:ubiquitinyl hydrolase 1 n=1 Tax=Schizophyllum amplum TaxID=97359 RepID=A0A550C5L4_9AGAR|nr:peptidase C65 Otubain-domain-containing protein [Auriculariopsis ampla]